MRVRKSVSALAVALIAVVSALVALPSASAATMETQAANRIYSLINNHRAEAGLAPLAWNPQISAVAQDWTEGSAVTAELAGAYTFHHNGSLPAGYPAGSEGWSENIVWNFNVDQAFSWWVNSGPHNANMLNPSFTDVGIGAVRLTAGPDSGAYMITADFGTYPAGSGGGLPVVSEADRIAAEKAEAEKAQKAEADRIAAEKAAAEKAQKAEADRIAAEKAAEKAEAERVAKAAADKAAAEKAGAERVAKAAADKAAADKAAADKAAADKAAADKAAADKAAADKAAADKAAADKAAEDKAASDKAAADKAAAQKAEADRVAKAAADKAAADKAAAEKAEADRVAAEQAAAAKEGQVVSPAPTETRPAPSQSPANDAAADAASQPEVEEVAESAEEPAAAGNAASRPEAPATKPLADPTDPAVLTDSARGGFAAVAHGSLLTLKGLTPNSSYRVVLHSTPVDLGLMTADSQGVIALEIPAELPAGNHRVALSSNGEFAGWQAFSVEAPVTVLGSAATAATPDAQALPEGTSAAVSAANEESQLAATGLNSWQLLTAVLGALLVMAGTAAILTVRRRTLQG